MEDQKNETTSEYRAETKAESPVPSSFLKFDFKTDVTVDEFSQTVQIQNESGDVVAVFNREELRHLIKIK